MPEDRNSIICAAFRIKKKQSVKTVKKTIFRFLSSQSKRKFPSFKAIATISFPSLAFNLKIEDGITGTPFSKKSYIFFFHFRVKYR